MFTVGPRKDALENLELRDTDAKSFVAIAPTRGGMVTRLALNGRHAFFLDEATLRDASQNVRGGNPVLFPSPGKLTDDAWAREGKTGTMKQHGFARSLPWEVKSTSTDGAAAVTLSLVSSDATRAGYPWEFAAEYTYSLRGSLFRVDMRISNTGPDPMPFGAGFHPYFHIKQSDKKETKVETTATRAFDNAAKKAITLSGIDLTRPEVDLHLLDHGKAEIAVAWPAGRIVLRGSNEFTHWVVWTLAGKDFVCVEPWTSAGNALNSGDGLLSVAPGETRALFVEYEGTR